MKKPDEYEILERAHEAAGAHMMQKSPRADELIACLEGEIAKRDARIAGLEAELVEARKCAEIMQQSAFAYQAELSAIKAQESVWRRRAGVMGCKVFMSDKCYQAQSATMKANYERVAPVSEAKAQGVVMPERMKEDANSNLEWSCGWNECLKEVARLNASPVQQVRVPDGYARVPTELTDEMLRAMKIQLDKSPVFWCRYRAAYRAMLAAAPAAPAADAWIPVSERLPDVPDGDEREVIVCVKRAHNGQSYSFSARYLNNFPLHSDSEEEPTFVTGWHDVKEHAEYDGWYSPLIDSSSGDDVTHWMPLPAANSAKGVV